MEPEIGAWVRERVGDTDRHHNVWYYLKGREPFTNRFLWDAYRENGTLMAEDGNFGDDNYWRRVIIHKQMHSPFEPARQEGLIPYESPMVQEELTAYLKFFRNSRGELAVACGLTPEALERGWPTAEDQNIKKIKISTRI